MSKFDLNITQASATTAGEQKPIVVTMEIHENVKKVFMEKYDRYEPVVKDHSAIAVAKECYLKYFYSIILGRVPNEEPIYFAWGSAYHRFREVLSREYGFGPDTPARYDKEKALVACKVAINAALKLWKERGTDQPVGSKFEFMTTERLIKSLALAFNEWEKERMLGRIEVLAIEQPFNVRLGDSDEYTSGRADEIVRWNMRLWGRDFKTSSKTPEYYSRTVDPNDQFTRYTYAEGQLHGQRINGQLIEVLFNRKGTKKKSGGPEIQSFTATRTPQQLDQWLKEELWWRKTLDDCRENDIYPMNENHCPYCPYHSVCSKASEGMKMAKLEANFTVRPWDNTKVGVIDD